MKTRSTGPSINKTATNPIFSPGPLEKNAAQDQYVEENKPVRTRTEQTSPSMTGHGSGAAEKEENLPTPPEPQQSWRPHTADLDANRASSAIKSIPFTASHGSSSNPSNRDTIRQGPWAITKLTIITVVLGIALLTTILHSFTTRHLDPKGYRMSYMRSIYHHFPGFDAEHTRFAQKYNLYLYREYGVDSDPKVKGVPILFIPGNAGSYKQVRSLASEAALHYVSAEAKTSDTEKWQATKRPFDFFTVDFNEDFTAFHGQTLLDQAEYLNDAIAYILSLYHDPSRAQRDTNLPDPCSVILVGHSMGGVVARTMVMMPNYQAKSINTIITLSAPHARPPVSFDADIVKTYQEVNDYWRRSYSQQWGNENPLWQITTVSIAGGGLDTIVPSDYSSMATIVPETHGFTVFTSTMPNVWTGTDHLSITWCDQLRKSVMPALLEVMDVQQPGQVKRRADRMRIFRKAFLTGLEDSAPKELSDEQTKTILALDDNNSQVLEQGQRLVIQTWDISQSAQTYLMPIPPPEIGEDKTFTLMHNFPAKTLDVLFCSVSSQHSRHASSLPSMEVGTTAGGSGSTRLTCKSAMADNISLPASTKNSRYPFDLEAPFSFVQYDLETIAHYQFAAVIIRSHDVGSHFAIGEFATTSASRIQTTSDILDLIQHGISVTLPSHRPMLMNIAVPAIHSSLLAYRLKIQGAGAQVHQPLFEPLVRQFITDVSESRYFVNVQEADISLHGVAPYMPSPSATQTPARGLSLQIWSDPTTREDLQIDLVVDVLGSMGKLWMRYRTMFAALPLLVVALALRKQFQVYDRTGIFISFSAALNESLKKSFPAAVLALTCLAYSFADVLALLERGSALVSPDASQSRASVPAFMHNDYLLGNTDQIFAVLMPIFALICFGICAVTNWAVLAIVQVLAYCYKRASTLRGRGAGTTTDRHAASSFKVTSTRQRVITTSILMFLVSTVVPYQFAYVVLCLVHFATCLRARRITLDVDTSDTKRNFYNYSHSIFILMLWILPINLPVLVVWIRNLAVHWLTPFSSHHNIICILPFVLLVETLSTGRMVPKISSRFRNVMDMLLFVLGFWAAVFGVSYAYQLHHFANLICAWLVLLHLSANSFSIIALVSEKEVRPAK